MKDEGGQRGGRGDRPVARTGRGHAHEGQRPRMTLRGWLVLIVGVVVLAGCAAAANAPGSTPFTSPVTATGQAQPGQGDPTPTAIAPGTSISPLPPPTQAVTGTVEISTALPSGPATVPAAVTPAVTPVTDSSTVTLGDNGKSITLRVGDRFLLSLGEADDWTLSIDDQSVVSRVMGVMTVRGSQGLFEGRKAGQTILRASGDPVCRAATPPCSRPSTIFQVIVVVQ